MRANAIALSAVYLNFVLDVSSDCPHSARPGHRGPCKHLGGAPDTGWLRHRVLGGHRRQCSPSARAA
eukprot:2840683-Alexandrium_andersonii.AAC.1